jgi:Arc-like DNA binding domain
MPREEAPDMKVRLSGDLRNKIESAARSNNRTMNAEIMFRLEQSFTPSSDQEKRLSALERGAVALIFDERFDSLERRLSAVESRTSKQSS